MTLTSDSFTVLEFSLEKSFLLLAELDSCINHSCRKNLDNAWELYVFDGKKMEGKTIQENWKVEKTIFLEYFKIKF